jgi:RNase H-fold protein (predicted Holliday junction resolvase)
MDEAASVLAIDPGRAKCGVAVVQQDGQALYRGIVAMESFAETITALIAAYHPQALVCGNGTGSKPILQILRVAAPALPLELVDETRTSERARARFVHENKPPLLQRLLPRSLRSPWLPYDDYVAVLLAERYWQSRPL